MFARMDQFPADSDDRQAAEAHRDAEHRNRERSVEQSRLYALWIEAIARDQREVLDMIDDIGF